jgi:hypothetical protein
MTEQHPITPPPELVQHLYGLPQMRAIEKAYQAGANQMLEACLQWINVQGQWQYVETPREKMVRLIKESASKEDLLKALEQLND